MGLPLKYLLILGFFQISLFADINFEKNRILFLLTQNHMVEAIDQYQSIYQVHQKHDYELLQQMSLLILDKGMRATDPEEQLLAIFGAAIANNDRSYYILEEGLKSSTPQIQLVALNFIAKTHNEQAYTSIHRLMNSPYALLRLEAAFQLAQNKHKKATAQIESLMQKIDPLAHPIFPQLFAMVGDDASFKILKKLLTNPDPLVRIASILSAAQFGRDDLLPQIRRLATQHDYRQQEAAAFALGHFKDEDSLQILKKLTLSKQPSVKIAAYQALYALGEKEGVEPLVKLAMGGDLFAIQALAKMPEAKKTLQILQHHSQIQIRINSTLALIEQKVPPALKNTLEILLLDTRDLAFMEIRTPGKALKAWKAVPSASNQGENSAILHELSLEIREDVLEASVELPEEYFLKIADYIFETKQNELIPLLVQLLVNHDSENSVALLKKQTQKAGAPLIRVYANLALFKEHAEPTSQAMLKNWVIHQQEVEILKFRTLVTLEHRDPLSTFELTPTESARLLIESLETLTSHDEDQGVDLLLQVLKDGHQRNNSLIAGLILKTVQ